MIGALLTYIINAYPQGVRICKMLDSLTESLMKKGALVEQWLGQDILNAINAYTQREEKVRNEFGDDWRLVEIPAGFVRVLF